MYSVHPSIHPPIQLSTHVFTHPSALQKRTTKTKRIFFFTLYCLRQNQCEMMTNFPSLHPGILAVSSIHPFILQSSFPSPGLPSLNELGQLVFCLFVVWLGWETECTSVCESFPSFCFWLLLLLSWAENVSLWANSKVFSDFTCHRHMLQSHPCLRLCTEECVTAQLHCLVLHGWTGLLVGS